MDVGSLSSPTPNSFYIANNNATFALTESGLRFVLSTVKNV